MRIIIDRIENDIAVCQLENGSIAEVPAVLFENAGEGRVYDIILNETAQAERENNAKRRLNALFAKGSEK